MRASLARRVPEKGNPGWLPGGTVGEDGSMTNDNGRIAVSRRIDAPASEIFNVLSNPERHAQLDGSGFIRSDEKSNRVTENGQVFTMNMEGDHMGGEYKTDNHVTGYQENKLLAWKTAPAGSEPPGWEWMWELTPQGQGATDVTLTYDWSKVTDKEILKKVTFPLVTKEQMEDSLAKLAESVSS